MKTKDKIAKIIAVKDYSLISGIDNNTIVVTATQNLKKNSLFNGAKSIMSFSDLTKFASNNIDNKNNLNSTEFRYIIHKTIEETIEPERVKVYQNCVPGLEELYTKLFNAIYSFCIFKAYSLYFLNGFTFYFSQSFCHLADIHRAISFASVGNGGKIGRVCFDKNSVIRNKGSNLQCCVGIFKG